MAVRCLLLLAIFLRPTQPTVQAGKKQPEVPAVMVFGDSLVDVGNNNYIFTVAKANFPPYGRDFKDHVATGRFCNGKLLIDFIAEKIGFNSSPPAYLSPQASGRDLLLGANFASATSGYNDHGTLVNAISFSQQLKYFEEYQAKLAVVAGSSHARSIISGSLYIISAGSCDFVFTYYINPFLYMTQSTEQFSDRLIGIFNNSVTQLYGMGARRIGVFSLPPFGCFPVAITLYGHGRNECVLRLNNDIQYHNMKLRATVDSLRKKYHDLKILVVDIYTPLYNLSTSPVSQGFTEAKRACCGTGTLEASILCNPLLPGTCPNARTYVFWDVWHPSEAANKVVVDSFVDEIKILVA
uniref:XAT-7Hch n=1 Tax=Hordeum chilense TaxID=15565 RepID=A0A7S9VNC2_HORCH|nr:XAT-7Hch [Hordeum chilense]QPI70818.1 XAT-7Hch [Hordeum chilense]